MLRAGWSDVSLVLPSQTGTAGIFGRTRCTCWKTVEIVSDGRVNNRQNIFIEKDCQFPYCSASIVGFPFVSFCRTGGEIRQLTSKSQSAATALNFTRVRMHHPLSVTCLWGAWPSPGSSGRWRSQKPPRWAAWGLSCCSDRGSRWSDLHPQCHWWRWASVWAIPASGSETSPEKQSSVSPASSHRVGHHSCVK